MCQSMTDFSSVVRMGGGTTSHKTQEISSCNSVGVASADSSGCLWSDPAWSHGTNAAADSLLPKPTMGSLIFYTKLPGIRSYFLSGFQKPLRCLFKLFNGCHFKIAHIFSSIFPPRGISSFYYSKICCSHISTKTSQVSTVY